MQVENGQGFPTIFYGAEILHYGIEAQEFKGMQILRSHTPNTNVEPGWVPSLNYYTRHMTLLKQCPSQEDNYFLYFAALLTTEVQPHSLGVQRKDYCYGCFKPG